MRAFSCACSLLVTGQRWRSHHSIRLPENPMLRANITALCFMERELLPIEVLHCMFDLFASCDLDLDLMTFIYELDL